jgi:hypothetical protein
MTIELTRAAGDPWWRASIVLNGHDKPRPFQHEQPVKGEYNGICQRFACDQTPALWYNQTNGRYYCSDCARTFNDVLRQQGRVAMCELHLSR